MKITLGGHISEAIGLRIPNVEYRDLAFSFLAFVAFAFDLLIGPEVATLVWYGTDK